MFHDQQDKDDVKKLGRSFVMDYLKHDGMLMMRLMSLNTNHLVTAEVLKRKIIYVINLPCDQRMLI